ncbi:MAG: transposase family protein, partial [Planctomycetota bacterium]
MVRAATFSPGKAFVVSTMTLTEDGYEVELEDRRREGCCPACGARLTRSHGWHRRTLQDLPIAGVTLRHRVALRRWRCGNKHCGRRTFTQADETVFTHHGRRTVRYDDIVFHLGKALGDLSAERLFGRLGLAISDDTILRHLVRKAEDTKEASPLRVVGIDNWAWKKQHCYGTIMLDLER